MKTLLICSRVLALCLVAIFANGCWHAKYIATQAGGQLEILQNRKSIPKLLERWDLPQPLRERFELVLLARQYAKDNIGLKLSGAYTYYYHNPKKPIVHNISAAPKDRLTPIIWKFPIIGPVPYLGFFDKKDAIKHRDILVNKGYDTLLRPVSAYSTLGWFDDPIYTRQLLGSEARLFDIVIHETTHNTIFLKGQIAFNESLATFIGHQGTLNLLALRHGMNSKEVKDYQWSLKRRRLFAKLIGRTQKKLKTLYASKITREEKLKQREEIFKEAQEGYKKIYPDPRYWGSFVKGKLNNAVILSYGRYNQGVEFHHKAYVALGRSLNKLVALYKFAQKYPKPIDYVARKLKIDPPTKQKM